jgi:hypothetical protein
VTRGVALAGAAGAGTSKVYPGEGHATAAATVHKKHVHAE